MACNCMKICQKLHVECNGDATKKNLNEKRNIYLSVKLMKTIHNQG